MKKFNLLLLSSILAMNPMLHAKTTTKLKPLAKPKKIVAKSTQRLHKYAARFKAAAIQQSSAVTSAVAQLTNALTALQGYNGVGEPAQLITAVQTAMASLGTLVLQQNQMIATQIKGAKDKLSAMAKSSQIKTTPAYKKQRAQLQSQITNLQASITNNTQSLTVNTPAVKSAIANAYQTQLATHATATQNAANAGISDILNAINSQTPINSSNTNLSADIITAVNAAITNITATATSNQNQGSTDLLAQMVNDAYNNGFAAGRNADATAPILFGTVSGSTGDDFNSTANIEQTLNDSAAAGFADAQAGNPANPPFVANGSAADSTANDTSASSDTSNGSAADSTANDTSASSDTSSDTSSDSDASINGDQGVSQDYINGYQQAYSDATSNTPAQITPPGDGSDIQTGYIQGYTDHVAGRSNQY